MKKLIAILFSASVLYFAACNGSADNGSNASSEDEKATTTQTTDDYDPNRGEGKWDKTNVDVSTFDAALAEKGHNVSQLKCFSCHKTTDERLVGPGWQGVTTRRTPEWIMNFITNPDPMIDKDPEVQAQLEICLVRMPNQSLVDDEARAILEYMRQIDGAK